MCGAGQSATQSERCSVHRLGPISQCLKSRRRCGRGPLAALLIVYPNTPLSSAAGPTRYATSSTRPPRRSDIATPPIDPLRLHRSQLCMFYTFVYPIATLPQ